MILTGFGEGNQQLRVNSPTWGLDNWVYLANGRSGGAVRRPDDPAGKSVPIPRNDLRLRPATGEFEPVAGFSQFGLPRDDWGDRFPSWNTVPIRHVVLEDRPPTRPPSRARRARWPRSSTRPTAGGSTRSPRRSGGSTPRRSPSSTRPAARPSTAGGCWRGYRGHAFVCEPLSERRPPPPARSRRPDLRGPPRRAGPRVPRVDAPLVPAREPRQRPGRGPLPRRLLPRLGRAPRLRARGPAELRSTSARGTTAAGSGGSPRSRTGGLAPPAGRDRPTSAGLVAMLSHPNGWCRDTAQRLLFERQDPAAVAPLRALARTSPDPLARVHALWTLDGLNALDRETLRDGLRADDPHVREQAVRLAARDPSDHAPELCLAGRRPRRPRPPPRRGRAGRARHRRRPRGPRPSRRARRRLALGRLGDPRRGRRRPAAVPVHPGGSPTRVADEHDSRPGPVPVRPGRIDRRAGHPGRGRFAHRPGERCAGRRGGVRDAGGAGAGAVTPEVAAT